ncbi:MAG: cell division protein FtsQ/DivIB [Candidatus Margulisbacteria bacterium]|nr:cell division protein FtsQ/DivIB [Candidatus Margulisiibacteriota bacterium]
MAFLFGCCYFLSLPIWQISNIVINGAKILLPEEIKTMAAVPLSSNLFFTSLKRTQTNLDKITAIRKYSIFRIPPGTIMINITEREPIATIVFAKRSVIIDKDGYILNGNPNLTLNIPDLVELPVITGLIGMDMLETDRVDRKSAQVAWNIIIQLDKFFKAKSIKLDLGGLESLNFLLDDTLRVKLGDDHDINGKMRVFEALLPQIAGQWQQVEYVDVRFVNNPVIRFK